MPITLKAARVNTGLTQKEAAKRLGVSNKTLWAWETGNTLPSAKKIREICELYKMPYDNIIFFNN